MVTCEWGCDEEGMTYKGALGENFGVMETFIILIVVNEFMGMYRYQNSSNYTI